MSAVGRTPLARNRAVAPVMGLLFCGAVLLAAWSPARLGLRGWDWRGGGSRLTAAAVTRPPSHALGGPEAPEEDVPVQLDMNLPDWAASPEGMARFKRAGSQDFVPRPEVPKCVGDHWG